MSINIAAKNNHVNMYDAHLRRIEITGDMKSKANRFCRVEVINNDNPLEHIINTGNISNIAV
jgi:hypothetical protein